MISEEEPLAVHTQSDAAIEAQIRQALARRQLEFYKPYPKQIDFHRTGSIPFLRERLMMAGNQCNGLLSTIDTGRATRQFRELIGAGPLYVPSWDGSSRCNTPTSPVFLRGIERAYLLQLENGQRLAFSAAHRLLTSTGWMSLDQFVRSSSGMLCVDDGRLPRRESVRSDRETTRDSMANYASQCRRDDALPPVRLAIDRSHVPSPDDAREHDPYLNSRQDAAVRKLIHSRHRQLYDRLPIQDDPFLLWDLCAQWEDPTSEYDARWPTDTLREWSQYVLEYGLRRAARLTETRRPSGASSLEGDPGSFFVAETPERCDDRAPGDWRFLSWCDPGQVALESLTFDSHTEIFFPYDTPSLIGESCIIAVIPLEVQPIIDITVEGTHNYISEGLVSHNCGKTMSAGAEVAFHATGLYPDWWPGRRFKEPVSCWVGGPTSQMTRDNPQKILMGEVGAWGTGMLPSSKILDMKKAVHGVADSLESVTVRHKTGGISRIGFKSYDQGRIRWQGSTIDFVWMDEEPPDDIYSEAMVRTQVKKGFIMMTFTPLLGMSKVVERYLKEKPEGSVVIKMGIKDALHYTDEERRIIIASYPESERKARAEGDPVLGSGKVFPIDFANLIEQPIQIPDYWPRICGLDIGWDHPTAASWLAWDRDLDIIHVYDEYRLKEQTPVVHAAAIKARGPWIPVAWPHDGMQHDSGSGKVIAGQYRALGVNMLPHHATHKPELGKKEGTGGYGLEAGIMDMLQRMQTGRWRVFSTCGAWKEEYELYYRKDGLIVKKGDDIMSSSRMANMMLRFAKVRVVKVDQPNLPVYTPYDSGMGI